MNEAHIKSTYTTEEKQKWKNMQASFKVSATGVSRFREPPTSPHAAVLSVWRAVLLLGSISIQPGLGRSAQGELQRADVWHQEPRAAQEGLEGFYSVLSENKQTTLPPPSPLIFFNALYILKIRIWASLFSPQQMSFWPFFGKLPPLSPPDYQIVSGIQHQSMKGGALRK